MGKTYFVSRLALLKITHSNFRTSISVSDNTLRIFLMLIFKVVSLEFWFDFYPQYFWDSFGIKLGKKKRSVFINELEIIKILYSENSNVLITFLVLFCFQKLLFCTVLLLVLHRIQTCWGCTVQVQGINEKINNVGLSTDLMSTPLVSGLQPLVPTLWAQEFSQFSAHFIVFSARTSSVCLRVYEGRLGQKTC